MTGKYDPVFFNMVSVQSHMTRVANLLSKFPKAGMSSYVNIVQTTTFPTIWKDVHLNFLWAKTDFPQGVCVCDDEDIPMRRR